jgi:MFS family permease
MLLAIMLSFGWMLVGVAAAAAQQVPTASAGGSAVSDGDLPDNQISSVSGDGTSAAKPPRSRQEEYDLTLIVMIAALLLTAAFVAMYLTGRGSDEFSRYYLAIIVVVAALFLMTAGYDEKQTAPAFGLLGTILGYIFGKMDSRTATRGRGAGDGATE